MKMMKNRKALSPVVASIILIAVTVAVSIAVAAWMGALSFTFMATEQVDLRSCAWTPNSAFNLTVYNTGTSSFTITSVWVNGVDKTSSASAIGTGLNVPDGGHVTFTVTFTYTNGTNYDMLLMTSKGNRFSKTFTGGTPS
jgi:flagellin-like protein